MNRNHIFKRLSYVYGPVPSWRLGRSLGIDPITRSEKVCTFDCIYCQIGKTRHMPLKRSIFVPVQKMVKELSSLPKIKIDYITFAGTGEPTLAKNLGSMIKAVRQVRNEKIAVLTNSSIANREDVVKDLLLADLVVFKLDAPSQDIFRLINRPARNIRLNTIIKAIKRFKARHMGRTALQIMFTEENKSSAKEIARIAKEIGPDEVQLNTPLRPCGVKPLKRDEMAALERYFKGLKIASVYRAKHKDVKPISAKSTLKRRGKV